MRLSSSVPVSSADLGPLQVSGAGLSNAEKPSGDAGTRLQPVGPFYELENRFLSGISNEYVFFARS